MGMDLKYKHLEMVRLTRELISHRKLPPLLGEVGIVVGWSDPYEDGHRDFGVHFNAIGETIAVAEGHLESLGRIADPNEIVTRSRGHQRRTRSPGDE
jgi:hypothetical protein